MTENPLRGSVSTVEIPYTLASPPTSASDRRTRLFLAAVCLLMFALGIIYVVRYSLTNPFVDEWAFMPVVLGEEPAGPWLWALHNEHRFPMPRALYIGLFRLTGDLRTGCVLSLLGMSVLAVGLIRLARVVRGRSSVCDAVFPLMLIHTGQGENLYMGYQMCFMLVAVFAGALLAVIVRSAQSGVNRFTLALLATVLGWLLLTCGAAGLAYGIAAAVWAIFLAFACTMKMWQRGMLVALAAITPIYIVMYFQGYVRPGHHPPSAGVVESIRIGLQAQAMAFGPAATGMWPPIGIWIVMVGLFLIATLLWQFAKNRRDSTSAGLLLFVIAGGAVAFGIGWGRSGFFDDKGFAWRYGWVTWSPIAAAYFTWLMRGDRVSTYLTMALSLLVLVVTPVNSISGFRDAETTMRPFQMEWEADVRAGWTAEAIVEKRFGDARPVGMIESMRLMRDRRYAYYELLGQENP